MIGALARLLGRHDADHSPPSALRWVVVDCEASGLDPQRDRLLSVGAVAVRDGRIDHADVFGAVLRQEQASESPNILVHGIGAQQQLRGREPAAALHDFAGYAARAPLVAFHAPFDEALLGRAMAASGIPWSPRWLDVAQLAPALFPKLARSCTSLDDWLSEFAIAHPARHEAVADAYATAQLLLILLAAAQRQGLATAGDLFAASRHRRWLG